MHKNVRTKFGSQFQPTALLDKPVWTPGSWENLLHLFTAAVPPALEGCWTPFIISSPNPGQFTSGSSASPLPFVPCLLTEASEDLLTKQGHNSLTPYYFAILAESKGTLKRWIKDKGFQGEYTDIFAVLCRILKASTSSSVFKELKRLAIPNAVLLHFNCITAPREAKKNITSLPTNIVTLFRPPLSFPVTLPREKVAIGCQNLHAA